MFAKELAREQGEAPVARIDRGGNGARFSITESYCVDVMMAT